ncbi:uncharacterized protein LOC133201300 [Saccostrea echinata]|uniref:uncharacterized protein LOC133201137 n=1 Tax=Saccostrea echinata TaxID=191078 RepID=UPI002A819A58|nr:uncharacterized protein LOC133201137 [Saccostrea echinata]XP_061193081.1 uncharacterized protein LOC133201300 [Saccostrea echinata]
MSTKRKFSIEDIDGSVQKKPCMYILDEQQILHLLTQKEPQMIERMEVMDATYTPQAESQKPHTGGNKLNFPINSFPLQGLNNNNHQSECMRCLAGEPGHFRHVKTYS